MFVFGKPFKYFIWQTPTTMVGTRVKILSKFRMATDLVEFTVYLENKQEDELIWCDEGYNRKNVGCDGSILKIYSCIQTFS